MLHHSSYLIYFTVYLVAHLPYLVVGGVCCEGDSTCSGCWMCPGSDLRICWDQALSMLDKCEADNDIQSRAECYCKAFSKIAKCWSQGKCCTEYAPTLAAATNVCNLATWPPGQLTSDHLEKVVGDANWARNTIWHNDSGKDVPKLSVYVQKYSSSQSTSSSYSKKSVSTGSSSYEPANHSDTTYMKKSTQKHKTTNKTQYFESETPSHQSESKTEHVDPSAFQSQAPQHKSIGDHHSTIHHHAKCSVSKHKCESQVASQYHHARRAHSKSNLAKRADSPLHKNSAELWKRSEIEDENGAKLCGIDFQGVPYPDKVPDTVASMFAVL